MRHPGKSGVQSSPIKAGCVLELACVLSGKKKLRGRKAQRSAKAGGGDGESLMYQGVGLWEARDGDWSEQTQAEPVRRVSRKLSSGPDAQSE